EDGRTVSRPRDTVPTNLRTETPLVVMIATWPSTNTMMRGMVLGGNSIEMEWLIHKGFWNLGLSSSGQEMSKAESRVLAFISLGSGGSVTFGAIVRTEVPQHALAGSQSTVTAAGQHCQPVPVLPVIHGPVT